MGRERDDARPPAGCAYLRELLEDGVRPFLFRKGVRNLLGIVDGEAVTGNLPRFFLRADFLPATDRRVMRTGFDRARELPGMRNQRLSEVNPTLDNHHADFGGVTGCDQGEGKETAAETEPGGRTPASTDGNKTVRDTADPVDKRDEGPASGFSGDEHRVRTRQAPAVAVEKGRAAVAERLDGDFTDIAGYAYHDVEQGDAVTIGSLENPPIPGMFFDPAAPSSPLSEVVEGAFLRQGGAADPGRQAETFGDGRGNNERRYSLPESMAQEPHAQAQAQAMAAGNDGAEPGRLSNPFIAGEYAGRSSIVIPGVTFGRRDYDLEVVEPERLCGPAGTPDAPDRVASSGNSESPPPAPPMEKRMHVDAVGRPISDEADHRSACNAGDELFAQREYARPGLRVPKISSNVVKPGISQLKESHSDVAADVFNGSTSPPPAAGAVEREAFFGSGHRGPGQDVRCMSGITGSSEETSRHNVDRLVQAAKKLPTIDRLGSEGATKDNERPEPVQHMPTAPKERGVLVRHVARRSAGPAAFWERSSLGRISLRPLR